MREPPILKRFLYLLDGHGAGKTIRIDEGCGVLRFPVPLEAPSTSVDCGESAVQLPKFKEDRYIRLPVKIQIFLSREAFYWDPGMDVVIELCLASCTRSEVWPSLVAPNGTVREPYRTILQKAANNIAMNVVLNGQKPEAKV